jgi:dUTP pyrophosphatase
MLIKKLHEDGIVPNYTTTGAVAFDVRALEDIVIVPKFGVYKVRTGLAFAVPEGYELSVRPRSGLSIRYPNYIANSPGTIDYDYRGELMVLVINNTDASWQIRKGDRIAQCVLSPIEKCHFELVDELPETERGAGGFGHTGVK